ncbi:MAG: glutaredoxin family protein [Actinomycetota bacterium]
MITVYSRPRCCLCDAAISRLIEAGIAYELVDITTDSALEAEFGIFVPVVQVDGKTVFEAGMNPAGLIEKIK